LHDEAATPCKTQAALQNTPAVKLVKLKDGGDKSAVKLEGGGEKSPDKVGNPMEALWSSTKRKATLMFEGG